MPSGVAALPLRGPAVRELGLALPLPPRRMPLLRAGRPLKRWRYVGYYGPELMLCVGEAWVGVVPQRFWALAEPGRPILERTTQGRGGVRFEGSTATVDARGVHIHATFAEGEGVETASPAGPGAPAEAYVWTRKQAAVPVRGFVDLGGRRRNLDGLGVVDDSAGYHARHTAWRWSAGVGRLRGGERVGWNLVTGVHDAAAASERSVWVEGEPREVGPVRFADDLSGLEFSEGGVLAFSAWSERRDDTNLLLFRSRYRQPFGTFTGTLPGGLELAEGYGVMEDHDALW